MVDEVAMTQVFLFGALFLRTNNHRSTGALIASMATQECAARCVVLDFRQFAVSE